MLYLYSANISKTYKKQWIRSLKELGAGSGQGHYESPSCISVDIDVHATEHEVMLRCFSFSPNSNESV